jgi:hypothetical protein
MDNNETTIARIRDELAICYEHIGRKAPESLPVIAASLQEAIKFSSPEHVHEIFKRAKDIESIPTQKTLKECYRNYSEEVLKYRDSGNGMASIEYRDPREAWLPKNPVMRAINRTEAVKNYCIACGGNAYWRLCDAKARGKETYGAFMAQVMAVVARLYSKYWRSCPIANGYPATADVTLELIPATVDDFRNMFAMEHAGHV